MTSGLTIRRLGRGRWRTSRRRARSVMRLPRSRRFPLRRCGSNWVCLYDFDDFSGSIGRYQSLGWQDLWVEGWDNRAESINNTRGGAALLAFATGGGGGLRYCSRPNSSDADLSNNAGISNTASSIFNSDAPDYHAGWDCFNPY